MYPPALQALADLFAGLPESERRELLIHHAEGSARYAPREGEVYDVEDLRHDAECTDAVGIHLRVNSERRCHVRVTLGREVQTLTRALTAILCQALEGVTLEEILALPESFVDDIAGPGLVRLRSRTVYYVLRRIKEACARLLPAGSADK